jgi:hypothetical protein
LAIFGDCTVEEMKNNVDVWMSDRAGDNETFHESIGIPASKNLKCCAHVTLGIDNACDKVFRNAEQRIGVQNLISVKVGDKAFSSTSSSIHILGEIAISKLLSPSHASHSVSLYTEFVQWMEQEGLDRQGFKGFTANRFGRIAQIANQFLIMKDHIIRFFDSVVDTNSNKLVLAVTVYIQNDWFNLCCELYGKIADLIIFPLMNLLGIDARGENMKDMRDWCAVKDFFKVKIQEVEELSYKMKLGDGRDRLYSAMLQETSETLRRQLSAMPFFHDILDIGETANVDLPDSDKLKYAPLSNLGCESEFAWFDNRVKISGGTESVQSLSRKKVIYTNGLLVDSSFATLTNAERAKGWKWARTSDEASEVRDLEKDFLATVQLAKKLVLVKKEQLKRKKNIRLMQTIDLCKEHDGPVTASSLNLLDGLSEKELLQEVVHLRLTIAPSIRHQRRVKDSTGKFRMEKFTAEELRTSIRNVIKPEEGANQDIEGLLLEIFH